jgi:FkbM family methyltransferase
MITLEVREISNKYGTLLHMGTKKRLDISQPHIENLTHEAPIVQLLENSVYDVFVDIGAAYGYFTRIASHYAKRVHAYEPHPIRAGFLRWNTTDLTNVEVLDFPIGTGERNMFIAQSPAGMVGSNHVHRINKYDSEPVPLDDEYWQKNKKILVKIDVEGNELDVIRSGERLKGQDNVWWIVELHTDIVKRKDLLKEFEGYAQEKILERKATEHWLFY